MKFYRKEERRDYSGLYQQMSEARASYYNSLTYKKLQELLKDYFVYETPAGKYQRTNNLTDQF